MDRNGIPSGARTDQIAPSIHSALGPKLVVIDMRPSGRDLDVQSGQAGHADVPAEPDR
jgi:hypothetical protein